MDIRTEQASRARQDRCQRPVATIDSRIARGGAATPTTGANSERQNRRSAVVAVVTALVWPLVAFVALAVASTAVLYWPGTPNLRAPSVSAPRSPRSWPAPHGRRQTSGSEPSTDEQRILAMLEENGGRLRQGEIAGRTDWSKSKVSRLLAGMQRRQEVRKVSVGRENVIFLPGFEPDIVSQA